MHFLYVLRTFLSERHWPERGASLVEYALLVGLIAIVCLAALVILGDDVSQKVSDVGQSLKNT